MACQIEKNIFLTHLAPRSASAFGFIENVGQSHDGPLFLLSESENRSENLVSIKNYGSSIFDF